MHVWILDFNLIIPFFRYDLSLLHTPHSRTIAVHVKKGGPNGRPFRPPAASQVPGLIEDMCDEINAALAAALVAGEGGEGHSSAGLVAQESEGL